MQRTQHRYSVWYEYSPGAPPPLSAIYPKTQDEIVYALFHFGGDVAHHLLDAKAEAMTSELLPGNRVAVTIKTAASKDDVDAAVVASCRALGLRAERKGGVEVP